MADPYDYTGRDGRGNDKLWHEEEDEERVSYDDRDELDKPYWPADYEDDVELTDEQQRVLDEDLDYDGQEN